MRIGSLFSGIGGLELGLERAGLGEVVWQVESNAFCRAILAAHWPKATRFTDVRTVDASVLPPADLLCGGFPCQDVSSAGRGAGLDGARSGLWWEFARIIEETRPRWVVVENVASGARRWLPAVRRSLWAQGYASVPLGISAAEVGARHRRERIFVVASDADRVGRIQGHLARCGDRGLWQPSRSAAADPDGAWELQPGRGVGEVGRRSGDGAAPHSDCQGPQDGQRERADLVETPGTATERDPGAVVPWEGLPARPWMVRGVHGLPGGVDGPWRAAGWTPARLREARIRALGNSVVPACAEVVGRAILMLEAGR